jgi:NAD+ diphosphatase
MASLRRLGPLALSRSAVDRNADRRRDDSWLEQRWSDPRTRVLQVQPGRGWVHDSGVGDRPTLALVPSAAARPGERYLLGTDTDDITYFAVRVEDPDAVTAQLPTTRSVGLREVGLLLDDRDAGLLVHAIALANWHASHRHCPRCGARTEVAVAGAERHCPSDGSAHFPRTDPAVIMTVVDAADRLLLGRQEQWPVGRFSTLAGFVEPGEDAERAVAREVMEEAGVAVRDVRYLGSQPWPFPASLMLGFTAVTDTPELATADGVELAEVRWFTRESILDDIARADLVLSAQLSIARRLIEHWYGGPLPDSSTPWG